MRVQIHKPLWGGFPKHWAKRAADGYVLTDREAEASGDYTEEEANAIAGELAKTFPGAVVGVR